MHVIQLQHVLQNNTPKLS